MKYYRTWQLFVRERRRYQRVLLFILGLLATYFIGRYAANEVFYAKGVTTTDRTATESLSPRCRCSQSSVVEFSNGECFFEALVCYPGFGGEQCDVQLTNEVRVARCVRTPVELSLQTYRAHCPLDTHGTQWTRSLIEETRQACLESQPANDEWKRSCLFLCFYHRLTGVIQVPRIFWHRALTNELHYWKENPTFIEDRLYEHVEGFDSYANVPQLIESIVEIGAGPFTQVQYLLTSVRSIEQITLIEPNALEYMKLSNCAYRSGQLRGYPVTIIARSIEAVMKVRRESRNRTLAARSKQYSAVISMNVVEHVSDALEYFRGLYDLLEDDGLLIFHERWFDYPPQGDCVLGSAENLHPIRITRWIVDRFLQQFDTLFVNFNQTKRQKYSPCFEQGIYFIGRKKAHRC